MSRSSRAVRPQPTKITSELVHAVGQCWSTLWRPTARPEDELDDRGGIVKYGLPTKYEVVTQQGLEQSFEVARRRVAAAAR